MDKSISEYEGMLLKINKNMINNLNEKIFSDRLDATKNLDVPFSISKLVGEYDYQFSNVFYHNFFFSINFFLVYSKLLGFLIKKNLIYGIVE